MTLSIAVIQEDAKSLCEDLMKCELQGETECFTACSGWFERFRAKRGYL
jgi:hypothetical protein